jgi:hypothetical protein
MQAQTLQLRRKWTVGWQTVAIAAIVVMALTIGLAVALSDRGTTAPARPAPAITTVVGGTGAYPGFVPPKVIDEHAGAATSGGATRSGSAATKAKTEFGKPLP